MLSTQWYPTIYCKSTPKYFSSGSFEFLGTWFILYCNIRPLLLPNHVRAKTCERRCVDGTHVLVDTMPHRESCNIYIWNYQTNAIHCLEEATVGCNDYVISLFKCILVRTWKNLYYILYAVRCVCSCSLIMKSVLANLSVKVSVLSFATA